MDKEGIKIYPKDLESWVGLELKSVAKPQTKLHLQYCNAG